MHSTTSIFESEDQAGAWLPAAARESISPAVSPFLTSIPENAEDRARFFDESRHVIAGNPPLVQLLATVEGRYSCRPRCMLWHWAAGSSTPFSHRPRK